MIVLSEEELHWRFVNIWIKVPRESLDLDLLRRELGARTKGPLLRLLESDDPNINYSVASITPAHGKGGDENDSDHIIQIATYRSPGDEIEFTPIRFSDTRFFDVLQASIHDVDQLRIISTADLFYPASNAHWRLKMLASQPKLEEFQSEIGKISLSGVKLRFSDSPHGLRESHLEVSPDENEYQCSLTVVNDIPPDQLSHVRRTVLNQAEEFAHLFVEVVEGS